MFSSTLPVFACYLPKTSHSLDQMQQTTGSIQKPDQFISTKTLRLVSETPCSFCLVAPFVWWLPCCLLLYLSDRFLYFFVQSPQEMLAQSVLAEVPGQVVSFFTTMKLRPPQTATPVTDLPATAPSQWFILGTNPPAQCPSSKWQERHLLSG